VRYPKTTAAGQPASGGFFFETRLPVHACGGRLSGGDLSDYP